MRVCVSVCACQILLCDRLNVKKGHTKTTHRQKCNLSFFFNFIFFAHFQIVSVGNADGEHSSRMQCNNPQGQQQNLLLYDYCVEEEQRPARYNTNTRKIELPTEHSILFFFFSIFLRRKRGHF